MPTKSREYLFGSSIRHSAERAKEARKEADKLACTSKRSPLGNRKPFTKPKIAGITINVSSVEEIMPPIIGTAMRCMISEPVPVLHMIGSGPTMMANHRHHLRTNPLHGALHDGVVEVAPRQGPAFHADHEAARNDEARSR
jgi:hypothetical protein